MRDEATPGLLSSGATPPKELRPPLALRLGASGALGLLVGVLGTALVAPSVLGRPDAPGLVPAAVAIALSVAGVVLLVGCWRVRLTVTPDAVTRVRLFSDADTVTLADARRIEISTALAEGPTSGDGELDAGDGSAPGHGSGSILPTIVLTGPAAVVITSRESRREADALLPHLLDWSRARPELIKDARTLRFLTVYARSHG